MTTTQNQLLSNKRVLVAEDNEVNQLMMTLLLQKWGAEVVLVDNGNEALNVIVQQVFDLVIMDIEMPGMNGLEAVKHIRKSGNSIPVIGITHTDYMGRAMSAGMNNVLRKPVEPKALLLAIEGLLLTASPS